MATNSFCSRLKLQLSLKHPIIIRQYLVRVSSTPDELILKWRFMNSYPITIILLPFIVCWLFKRQVLWELLTHEVPFKGIEGFQIAWMVVENGKVSYILLVIIGNILRILCSFPSCLLIYYYICYTHDVKYYNCAHRFNWWLISNSFFHTTYGKSGLNKMARNWSVNLTLWSR